MGRVIYWFRRDLRLSDQPGLLFAAQQASRGTVLPLFVVDENLLINSGPNRVHLITTALKGLRGATEGALCIRIARGGIKGLATTLASLAKEVGATLIVAAGEATPYARRRDAAVKAAVESVGSRLVHVDSPYVVAPGTLRATSGRGYRVFTAYHRAWLKVRGLHAVGEPDVAWEASQSDLDAGEIPALAEELRGEALLERRLLPVYFEGLPLGPAEELLCGDEASGVQKLELFCQGNLAVYDRARNRLEQDATSRLSAYLSVGSLHPRTVLARASRAAGGQALLAFERSLCWRDFFADLLWHFPHAAWKPLKAIEYPVAQGEAALEAFRTWALGRTGFPLVDAGMRQLLKEGFMPNRVRMAAASFLIFDLHLDWRWGARWFLWHLFDADIASNNQNWQWVAGVGADTAAYPRIFNPDLQLRRFDPEGRYCARYLEQSENLKPMLNHAQERKKAIEVMAAARKKQLP